MEHSALETLKLLILYIKKLQTASLVINNVLLITTNLGLTLTGQTVSLILSTGVGSRPPRYIKGCACNIEIMKVFSFESAKKQYSLFTERA